MSKSKAKGRLLETEWELLGVLWDRGPETASGIAEALAERRGWAYSTVKTLLDRMAAKGLVASRRVGHIYEYRPAIEPDDAKRAAWRRFIGDAFGGAIDPALRFIVNDAKLSSRQRERLRRLVEDLDRPDS